MLLKYGDTAYPFIHFGAEGFVTSGWTKKAAGHISEWLLEHPLLIAEKRSRMKIMLMNPEDDLPVEAINIILQSAISVLK
jgi:hypothetical protein